MTNRPVALVTGSGRGIGRSVAETLANEGWDLALLDRAEDGATASACQHAGAATLELAADLAEVASHRATIERVMDRFGRLDALVNNAGIGAPRRGDLLELEPAEFDLVLDVNLRGTIFLTHEAARAMLAQDTATVRSIVTITSVSAAMANPERVAYCVSKAGLSMWVRNLALRLASSAIGVFEVRPGIIRTDMTEPVAARYDGLIEGGLVPMGRWGETGDVAAVVVALLRPGFGFSTGSVIHVDGALSSARF